MKANMSSLDVPTVTIEAPLADRLDIGTDHPVISITNSYMTANHIIVYDTPVVPTNAKHLIPKEYADNNFYSNTVTLNNIAAPTADLSLNSHKITNLATPTANTDAVTKQYVDNAISGTSAT
jgi:DNA-binding GntR family transcriptional regulator